MPVIDLENELEELMRRGLPETGYMFSENGLFMEAIDPTTRQVWMTTQPVSRKQFDDWSPKPPHQKVGCEHPAMDRAAFRHDPVGPPHAIQTKIIDGYECLHVAVPGEMIPPADAGLPAQISVTKGHTLGFKAGRRVKFMNIGDAHYVETVGGGKADENLRLPPSATFSELKLTSHWVVDLPCPTTTFFWFSDNGMRSFQGPIQFPNL
jgi:hypothetical protein